MKKDNYIYIFDYIFALAGATGLALNVFSSFVISEELTKDYPVILIAGALVMGVLFLSGLEKISLWITGVAGSAGIAAAVIMLVKLGLINETENKAESTVLFFAVLVISHFVFWFFTRRHRLCLAFAAAAMFICGIFSFLEYPVSFLGLVLLSAGLIMQILCRSIYEAAGKANYGRLSFFNMAVQNIAVTAVVTAAACGVYFGIIRPMHPPEAELKLITEEMSWDIVEKIGISTNMETENFDLFSNNLNDTLHKTNQKDDEQSDSSKEQSDSEDATSKNDDMQKKSQNRQSAFSISYDNDKSRILFVLLLVLAVLASPFAVKYMLRKRRREKIENMSPSDGAAYLYKYFLSKFPIVHIAKGKNVTVLEYARDNARELKHFDTENGVTFAEISETYNRMIYGKIAPTQQEYSRFKEFYDSFCPNVKKRIGKFRYAFMFWVL